MATMPTNIQADGTPAGQYSLSFNNPYYLNTTDDNGQQWVYNTPAWMSTQAMNEAVGLMNDYGQYNKILDNATRAQGIADRGAYQQVAAQTYDQYRANQNSVLQSMRAQQAQAIMNGAAKGVQASAQLLAMQQMNEQNASLMTQLRQQQAQTYLDENAQIAANVAKAVEYVDANRQYLGNLARDRYSIDWQGLIGAGAAASEIIAARAAAAAEKYAADKAAAAQVEAAQIYAAASSAGGGGSSGGGGSGGGSSGSSTGYGADGSMSQEQYYYSLYGPRRPIVLYGTSTDLGQTPVYRPGASDAARYAAGWYSTITYVSAEKGVQA